MSMPPDPNTVEGLRRLLKERIQAHAIVMRKLHTEHANLIEIYEQEISRLNQTLTEINKICQIATSIVIYSDKQNQEEKQSNGQSLYLQKVVEEVERLTAEVARLTTLVSAYEEGEADAEYARRQRQTGVQEKLASIRSRGWVVAVHNDYRLNGEQHTFWLFTRGDYAAKGEGRTDDEALEAVLAKIDRLPASSRLPTS